MIRNYLKIALRNFGNNKIHALINILGLSIGIASCAIIFWYVYNEMTFDRYHAKKDRLFRLEVAGWACTSVGVGTYVRDRLPEVESVVQFRRIARAVVENGDNRFIEKKGFYADGSVFDAFSFPLISGDPHTALSAPNSIILTRAMAEKYFGSEEPLGRRIRMDNADFNITGILEDLPDRSHFKFDFLVSFNTIKYPPDNARIQWGAAIIYTYVLLKEKTDRTLLENKISTGLWEKFKASFGSTDPVTVSVRPISDIHLYAKCEKEIEPGSDISNIFILMTIALFILVTAIFNFVNLATAGMLKRSKEVGLRKTLGAERLQIVRQFLSESVLTAMAASGLAIVWILFLVPPFETQSNIRLYGSTLSGALFLVLFMVFGIGVGIVSGMYPAFLLSRVQPAHALKQTVVRSGWVTVQSLKKGLLVLQFIISTLLVIGASTVYQQLEFIQNKDLGLQKDQVLVLPISRIQQQKYSTLKSELMKGVGVLSVSASGSIPGERVIIGDILPEGAPKDEYDMRTIVSDFDFTETYGMQIAEGRSFSAAFSADSSGAFIINEKAKSLFEWKDAVGKNVKFGSLERKGPVVGVVRDFNFASLRTDVEPLALLLTPTSTLYNYLSIRFSPGSTAAAIRSIESVWNQNMPHVPFEFYFLDDSFDKLYQSEKDLQTMVRIFTFLAVVIACMGLFGLVSLSVEQRTKEIGIRKVVGAGVVDIVLLLFREFAILIVVANLLAWPLIYYVMSGWLEHFAYRVDFHFSLFGLALAASLALAGLTMSYRAIRAAQANPVEALKYE